KSGVVFPISHAALRLPLTVLPRLGGERRRRVCPKGQRGEGSQNGAAAGQPKKPGKEGGAQFPPRPPRGQALRPNVWAGLWDLRGASRNRLSALLRVSAQSVRPGLSAGAHAHSEKPAPLSGT